jgi:hypothetical protein
VRTAIKWQIAADVYVEGVGKAFGAGGEEGVEQLPVGVLCAEAFEDGARLESFADRGRVHPEEWSCGISVGSGPLLEMRASAAACAQTARDFALSREWEARSSVGGERCDGVRESEGGMQREAR